MQLAANCKILFRLFDLCNEPILLRPRLFNVIP